LLLKAIRLNLIIGTISAVVNLLVCLVGLRRLYDFGPGFEKTWLGVIIATIAILLIEIICLIIGIVMKKNIKIATIAIVVTLFSIYLIAIAIGRDFLTGFR